MLACQKDAGELKRFKNGRCLLDFARKRRKLLEGELKSGGCDDSSIVTNIEHKAHKGSSKPRTLARLHRNANFPLYTIECAQLVRC